MTTRGANPTNEVKTILEPQPVSSADLEWLAARRVGRMPPGEDVGAPLTRLRDEEER
ncbi:MAG TPA: hypothetical protein VH230_04850 [Stellaceae bacterium]|jgi:hypothetical protein|nr:hypothetical protein [Stellaceae bacterium]